MNLDKITEEISLDRIMLTQLFKTLPKKSRNKAINELLRSYRKNTKPLSTLLLKLSEAALNQKKLVGCITKESLHELFPFSNGDYSLFLKLLRSTGLFKIIRSKKMNQKLLS